MAISQQQKEADAIRSRELNKKRDSRSVRIEKVNNGYLLIETGTGEKYSYPGLGIPMCENIEEYREFDPTNIAEHVEKFFALLNSTDD